jgi:hypothetical protein
MDGHRARSHLASESVRLPTSGPTRQIGWDSVPHPKCAISACSHRLAPAPPLGLALGGSHYRHANPRRRHEPRSRSFPPRRHRSPHRRCPPALPPSLANTGRLPDSHLPVNQAGISGTLDGLQVFSALLSVLSASPLDFSSNGNIWLSRAIEHSATRSKPATLSPG